MVETHWASKDRYYCKFCNVWMQSDKMVRRAVVSWPCVCVCHALYCCSQLSIDRRQFVQAVKHHEQGKKHKEKVEETLKQKRKAKSDTYHSEKDLQEQLREIEEAAQARHAQDLAASGAPPPPPPRRPGQAPPPPPPRRPGGDFTKKSHGSNHRHDNDRNAHKRDDGEEEQEEEPKEDDFGVYATRGEVFLEGKRHEVRYLRILLFACISLCVD